MCPRDGRHRRRWAAATLVIVSLSLAPALAHAGQVSDQDVEEAFARVERLFGVFIEAQTIRDYARDGCTIRGVQPMFHIVEAQWSFNLSARAQAVSGVQRSWQTGQYLSAPPVVRRPFATRVNQLRRYLPASLLTLSCYEFETGTIQSSIPSFYVIGRPRLCGKLGNRTYYFDPDAGYRYEEGCGATAGPASNPLEDLLQ